MVQTRLQVQDHTLTEARGATFFYPTSACHHRMYVHVSVNGQELKRRRISTNDNPDFTNFTLALGLIKSPIPYPTGGERNLSVCKGRIAATAQSYHQFPAFRVDTAFIAKPTGLPSSGLLAESAYSTPCRIRLWARRLQRP